MKKQVFILQSGECKLSFSMNAKGIWTCSDLTIYCKNPKAGLKLSKKLMTEIDQDLADRNAVKLEVKENG